MRGLIALGLATTLVACSSAAPPNPNPDPVKPVEPTPVPVYTATDYPQSTGTGNMAWQVAADFTWDAFLPGAPVGQTAKVSMKDFYDPDGSRGINALVIITSAEWCGACQAEAQTLENKIRTTWGQDGVMIMELMIENTVKDRTVPEVTAAADRWRAKFGFTDITVGIDPSFHFQQGGTNGLPVNVVIDPRTMTAVQRTDGSSSVVDQQISKLVAKNKL
jgi:hypothetical protein